MKKNIGEYYNQGLCISCGICAGNCPKSCIEMKKEGHNVHPIVNETQCVNCGICRSVCPNANLSVPHLDNSNISGYLLGDYKEILCVSSKNEDILKQATSGGAVTTIVESLINYHAYDSAFLVSGYDYLSHPVQTRRFGQGDSLVDTQKSRYLTVDHSAAVKYMLSNRSERIIFVGTPCAITGILNTINLHRLERSLYLLIGLFCDKTMHYGVVDYFANYDLSGKEMDELYFRTKEVGGWPGGVRLHYKDGTNLDLKNTERMKVKDFFMPERCLYCLDKLNRCCDLAVGDNYIPTNADTKGRNSIIVRTEIGENIWNKCKRLFDCHPDNADSFVKSASLPSKLSNYYHGCLKGIYHTNNSIPESIEANYRLLQKKASIGNKANTYKAVQRYFKNNSKSKKKLSIFSIIRRGVLFACRQIKKKIADRKTNCKTFLICGANFNNKGAQAMLFTTAYELRARFPECHLLFNTREAIPDEYDFKVVYFTGKQLDELQGNAFLSYGKLLLKMFVHRRLDIVDFYFLRSDFKSVDAIIDVSGFALSSQFDYHIADYYLKTIESAKRFHIPVFLMPQSFGPFEFGEKKDSFQLRIKNCMSYPEVVFAREESGYHLLKSAPFIFSNVVKSVDLVLQNKYLDMSLFSSKPLMNRICNVNTEHNIAIIPNLRTIDRGGAAREKLIDLYIRIISELIDNGFNVYLVRHSGEDLSICTELYESYRDKNNLYLLGEDYSCVEFNYLVKHFDFIIGSRYHSIVHSYKNSVPAIVLGWAEKYSSLVSLFGQEQYMFDIRNLNSGIMDEVLTAVKKMEAHYSFERDKINRLLPEVQKENCFDIISDYLKKT